MAVVGTLYSTKYYDMPFSYGVHVLQVGFYTFII